MTTAAKRGHNVINSLGENLEPCCGSLTGFVEELVRGPTFKTFLIVLESFLICYIEQGLLSFRTCLWQSKTSRIFFHTPSRFLTCLRRSCSGLGDGATRLLRTLLERLRGLKSSKLEGKNFGPERPTLGRETSPPKLEWVGDPLLVLLDNGSALENLFQPASPGTA